MGEMTPVARRPKPPNCKLGTIDLGQMIQIGDTDATAGCRIPQKVCDLNFKLIRNWETT